MTEWKRDVNCHSQSDPVVQKDIILFPLILQFDQIVIRFVEPLRSGSLRGGRLLKIAVRFVGLSYNE